MWWMPWTREAMTRLRDHRTQDSNRKTTGIRPAADSGRTGLERELGVQTEDARVHVRRHVLPAGDVRHEHLVEAQRHVVVGDVVDVGAQRQPLRSEPKDFLRRD